MSAEKFPEPWKVIRVGEQEFQVNDANGTKLFYIAGDEGDGAEAEPSVLFWSEKDEDTNYVAHRLIDMIEGGRL